MVLLLISANTRPPIPPIPYLSNGLQWGTQLIGLAWGAHSSLWPIPANPYPISLLHKWTTMLFLTWLVWPEMPTPPCACVRRARFGWFPRTSTDPVWFWSFRRNYADPLVLCRFARVPHSSPTHKCSNLSLIEFLKIGIANFHRFT